MFLKKLFKLVAVLLIALLGIFIIYNYFADRLLETIHRSSKPFDSYGVIIGEEAVEIKRGGDVALIIVHGYTSSPSRFHKFIEFLKTDAKHVDIFAPLLPFHGKGLEEFKSFNNDEIEKFVKKFLDEKSKEYKKIVVIGESYGALVLADILQSTQYHNATIIFSSPGFFLQANTPMMRAKMYIASKVMDYCPSCYGPYTTDEYSKVHARYAQKHGVVCFKSFLELLKLDTITSNALSHLQSPFTIIASRDDDVVDINKLENACKQNPKCTPFFVPDGGHFVHWGKYSEKYKAYLLKQLEE